MTENKQTYDLKFWLSLFGQIAVAFIIFILLSEWQAADMRDEGEELQSLTSPTLEGNTLTFPDQNALSGNTLVYFFAPWCTICDLSIGNLNLVKHQFNADVNIVIVALDYQSIEEVQEFVADKELNFPVILGDSRWAKEYQIRAFPSYYIIDDTGTVLSRTIGYSSTAGMLSRLAWHE